MFLSELKRIFNETSSELVDEFKSNPDYINYVIDITELKHCMFDNLLNSMKLSKYVSSDGYYSILNVDSDEMLKNFGEDNFLINNYSLNYELNIKTVEEIWDKYMVYANPVFTRFIEKFVEKIKDSKIFTSEFIKRILYYLSKHK